MDQNEVLETLKKDAGTFFDPELVEVFLDNIDAIRQLGAQFPDEQDAHA